MSSSLRDVRHIPALGEVPLRKGKKCSNPVHRTLGTSSSEALISGHHKNTAMGITEVKTYRKKFRREVSKATRVQLVSNKVRRE